MSSASPQWSLVHYKNDKSVKLWWSVNGVETEKKRRNFAKALRTTVIYTR